MIWPRHQREKQQEDQDVQKGEAMEKQDFQEGRGNGVEGKDI